MDRRSIEAALEALDAELAKADVTTEIMIAGGAAMVLSLDAREATRNLDAVMIAASDRAAFEACLQRATATRGLPSDWLNDRARAFAMGTAPGPVVFAGKALTVRSLAFEQLLAMKLSALRDDVDYDDAALLLARLEGEREAVWRRVDPWLVPGQEAWKRQNFDALWEDVHGPR